MPLAGSMIYREIRLIRSDVLIKKMIYIERQILMNFAVLAHFPDGLTVNQEFKSACVRRRNLYFTVARRSDTVTGMHDAIEYRGLARSINPHPGVLFRPQHDARLRPTRHRTLVMLRQF